MKILITAEVRAPEKVSCLSVLDCRSMVHNVGHSGEIVDSARRLKYETTADMSDIEKGELDRKTNR